MATRISLDFASDGTLDDFFDMLEKAGGSVVKFVAHGTGGGNPYVTLEFPTRAACVGYLFEYASGIREDVEFFLSTAEEV